ncbi:hypothetical protein GEMRC1_002402 [Eukaryota sp. GEM-RC1]
MSLSIRLNKPNASFIPGDVLDGFVVIQSASKRKHMGITVKAEGVVNLHAFRDGVLDSFASGSTSNKILEEEVTVEEPGKLPEGEVEFPFQLTLKPLEGKRLFESYSGVYVSVNYMLTAHIQGGLFGKSMEKTSEFYILIPVTKQVDPKPLPFSITKDSLRNSADADALPHFSIEGKLDSCLCDLSRPLTGSLTITNCENKIKSIEAQVLRIETIGPINDRATESTEIMNIQLAMDDPPRNIELPIYVLFPKLFVCSSTDDDNFKVQFQLNITVTLDNNFFISESLGFKLFRSSFVDLFH